MSVVVAITLSCRPRVLPGHKNTWNISTTDIAAGTDTDTDFVGACTPALRFQYRYCFVGEGISLNKKAVCCNPHSSSNWDSSITRQPCYKHNLCQNVVFMRSWLSSYFRKHINNCCSVKDLSRFFYLLYNWVSVSCDMLLFHERYTRAFVTLS